MRKTHSSKRLSRYLPQHSARSCRRNGFGFPCDAAVYQHKIDSRRKLVRIGEGGGVHDSNRIIDHDVSEASRRDSTASRDAEPVRWERGHLSDGLRLSEDAKLTHVAAQHAWEGAVAARVDAVLRHLASRNGANGVGSDHRKRVA